MQAAAAMAARPLLVLLMLQVAGTTAVWSLLLLPML
jgi:hypothetical protein